LKIGGRRGLEVGMMKRGGEEQGVGGEAGSMGLAREEEG